MLAGGSAAHFCIRLALHLVPAVHFHPPRGVAAVCEAQRMSRKWAHGWFGGRVAEVGSKGKVFILERMVHGRRYSLPVGTDVRTASAAWFAFKDDPVGFVEARETKRRRERGYVHGSVVLTTELVDGLTASMRAEKLSEKHVRNVRAYALQWTEDLNREDLRHVAKLQLTRALNKRKTARAHRIIALKTLCAYLTDQGLLDVGTSPARHLKVPQARAAQTVKVKGYSASTLSRVYSALADQSCRDVMRLQVCYGMHGTEVDRAARGNALLRDAEGHGEIHSTLAFPHKRGDVHVISLDAVSAAAVRRLQQRGLAPDLKVQVRALQAACKGRNIKPPLKPGQFRHSFVTLAQAGRWVYPAGQGVSLADVAEVTGHRSTATTKRFYSSVQVPRMLVAPVALVHAHDPVPIVAARQADG